MKFASLKHGRDGKLVVVSRDLTQAVEVNCNGRCQTLQFVLDNWDDCAPVLQKISDELNTGKAKGSFAFRQEDCASPLPRAYQWADGSAYVNHVELVRKARGADMPASFWTDPLMYQGGSDSFLSPTEDILIEDESWGIDFEAEVAVITGDVPMGAKADEAEKHIRLLMLVNDVSLRNLIPGELGKGFGFFQSKPSSSFSPVAVTPDELGEAWKDGKVHLPVQIMFNDKKFGSPNAGVDMVFNFPTLVAHAAKTRPLVAGSIIGSGTISNKDRSAGSGCLAEVRTLETLDQGAAKTPFMKFGDKVSIDMADKSGKSIFGLIRQTVRQYKAPACAATPSACKTKCAGEPV